MSQLIQDEMVRVFRELSSSDEEFHLYLTSRLQEYMHARHIVRYSLIEKFGADATTIDRVERAITGKPGRDRTKIMNSISIVDLHLKRDRARLFKLIQHIVYNL